jgi:hypothetical protein
MSSTLIMATPVPPTYLIDVIMFYGVGMERGRVALRTNQKGNVRKQTN